jgi:hypothetical protein
MAAPEAPPPVSENLASPVVVEAAAAPESPVVVPSTSTAATDPAVTTTTVAVTTTTVAVTTPTTVAAAPPVADGPDGAAAPAPISAAPTSVAPAATAPPTTIPPTTVAVAPIVGGRLRGSPSVVASGPRLDVQGDVDLTVADSTRSGTVSGRLGVEAPDPAGLRRLSGTLTIVLADGTVELRLAGHGTATDPVTDGVTPTSLAITGQYRASGSVGQLATGGTFSGSIADGVLVLDLAP